MTTLGYNYINKHLVLSEFESDRFKPMYDSYQIIKWRVYFRPSFNAATNDQPWLFLHTVVDYDDKNLTNIDSMLKYESYQIKTLNRTRYYTVWPKPLGTAYTAQDATDVVKRPLSTRVWMDLTHADTQYYGLKCAYQWLGQAVGQGQQNPVVNVHEKVWVRFRTGN